MKKVIVFMLLFVLSLALIINNPINAEKNEVKESSAQQIAYVDMQKLFENHPQKKSSEQELENEAKNLKEELASRGETMDKEARQKLLEKYQNQLNQQEQDLIEDVLADINKKINQVVETEEISLVLDKSAVIYGGQNITSKVLAKIKEDYDSSEEDSSTDDINSEESNTEDNNSEDNNSEPKE